LCISKISFAKEIQQIPFVKNYTSISEEMDSTKFIIDSLSQKLLMLDSINNSIKFQYDSLINLIDNKDQEIENLKERIYFADTCIVKLSNLRLYLPFNKEKVNEAIKSFDKIYSSKLKEDMSIILTLLKNYEHYYKEFLSIIEEAQKDDKNRNNIFNIEDYKNKYKYKIENMSYYINYYNGDWKIIYLNKQIDKALKILEEHSDSKIANFNFLIKELKEQ
jgi:hypothetical protein